MSARDIYKNWVDVSNASFVGYSELNAKNLISLSMWLLRLSRNFKFYPKTYALGMTILNKYLSTITVVKEKLQIIGCGSLLIASCLCEPSTPDVDDYVYASAGFDGNELRNVYGEIVTKLNGLVYLPNPIYFLNILSGIDEGFNNDKKESVKLTTRRITERIIQLLMTHPDSYRVKSHILTNAVIFMVRMSLGLPLIIDGNIITDQMKILSNNYYLITREVFSSVSDPFSNYWEGVLDVLDKYPKSNDDIDRSVYEKITRNPITTTTTTTLNVVSSKKILGEGAYGTVYKTKIGQSIVAIKEQLNDYTYCQSMIEIATMKRLNNKNIQGIKGFEFTKGNILISMSLQKRTLEDLIYTDNTNRSWDKAYIDGESYTRIPTSIRRRYAKDLMKGISVVHSYGIIHGDIKPANILISPNGVLKIADFGISQLYVLSDSDYVNHDYPICTLPYRPIDLLRHKMPVLYSFDVDIWSCGVTILEMEMGVRPFRYNGPNLNSELNVIDDIEFIVDKKKITMVVDNTIRKLLQQMLNFDNLSRISAKQAIISLE